MFEAARAGNTPAILWLLKRTEAAAASRAMRDPRPAPLGLKAQRDTAARRLADSGSRLAPPRPPKLIIVS